MIANPAEPVAIADRDMFRVENFYDDKLKAYLGRIFGCWHSRLTRPITRDRETYRACLHCGMRRKFDLQTWTSQGQFYMPRVERWAQVTKFPKHDH
jgi:hypothetical protein